MKTTQFSYPWVNITPAWPNNQLLSLQTKLELELFSGAVWHILVFFTYLYGHFFTIIKKNPNHKHHLLPIFQTCFNSTSLSFSFHCGPRPSQDQVFEGSSPRWDRESIKWSRDRSRVLYYYTRVSESEWKVFTGIIVTTWTRKLLKLLLLPLFCSFYTVPVFRCASFVFSAS